MKKTLVAVAALAAVSAFAQSSVTLSGKLGVAFTATNAAGVKGSGISVTDGNVTFAAVEDLGGGLKAGANMDVRVRGRATTSLGTIAGVPAANTGTNLSSSSVDGRDATVYIQGGFGRLTAGAVESANGILSLGSGGGAMIGLDNNRVLDSGVNIDMVRYDVALGGFGAYVALADSIGAPGANGLQKTAVTTDGLGAGLTYANGPLAVAGDYTSFGKNAAAAGTKNRLRLSTSYDLGVAKLGFGYQTKKAFGVGATANKQMVLGVAVPFGPATFGLNYGRNSQSGAATVTGIDVGVNYALSKRTAVQTAFERDKSNAVGALANRTFRVRLLHSF